MKLQIKIIVIILSLSLLSAGCSIKALDTVKPWERGDLASDLLRSDLNTLEETDWDHIYFSKEGTSGGYVSGGGGCGCN